MRVLIVKVSSLGDIIHTLPAVTDAWHADRRLRFDWVVEESFAEVPTWHPAVERVIPVALRRWRHNVPAALRSGEFAAFRRNLKQEHYDVVIDAQGLIKSGIISRLARGLTVGLSDSTAREPLATLFYNKVYSVPTDQHAVLRVRELFSRALNYSIVTSEPSQVDYGLDLRRLDLQPNDTPRGVLLFLHGTTWPTKHWPLPYWQELARLVTRAGYSVRLPWGSPAEQQRAHQIAQDLPGVSVLERQSLTGLARHIALADGVVAVDTGLGHLAAALATPTVSLYGPTNPGLSGTFGRAQLHLASTLACAPCMSKQCRYSGPELGVEPACYSSQPPAAVFAALQALIAQNAAAVKVRP
ncbi:MAG: heptosyltransferase [Pseudomonadota bacterium]